MAHQNPPYLAFCTPGQNETKNKIHGYQRETNKNIHIFLNEHQSRMGKCTGQRSPYPSF